MITLKEARTVQSNYPPLSESINTQISQMKQFPHYENQPISTQYHNTPLVNVESILQKGILLSRAKFSEYEGSGIWVTHNPGKGYGGRTVAFDSSTYELEKVNDDEYRVWEDIKPEDILFVDFFITETNRVSELPDLITKLGYDRVLQVVKKKADQGKTDVEFKEIQDLVDKFLNGGFQL